MKSLTLSIALLLLPSSALAQAPAAPATKSAQAVDDFLQHVDREWPGEAQQQSLTGESLKLLVNAVDVLAHRKNATSAEFSRALERVRDETARYIAGSPGQVSQSRQLRQTLRIAAEVVRQLAVRAGVARNIGPRLNALDRAAGSLDDDQPLRRQPDVLERFFQHAAEILKTIDAG